jgi:DNA-binding CsgD family transcriptional regulator
MPERDDFLKTVEAVHAAALDDSVWPAAMRAVARLFGAGISSYEVFDKGTMSLKEFRADGLPPGGQLDYLEVYSRGNPRVTYAVRNPQQKILCDGMLIDERSMDRDAYYTKYLRPLGLRYFMSGKLADTADTHAIMSIQRSQREGHVTNGDVERMRRLLPHLRLAHDVSTRLKEALERSGALEQALDWLADGALIVRADGKVIYANGAAQAIARRRDGIGVVQGQIEVRSGGARAQFVAALGDIVRMSRAETTATMHDFAIEREGAPPYLVSVRPLMRDRHRSAPALAIVFVRDPLRRDASTVDLLREIFGLTEAEASLARALQGGTPLAAYARANRLSLNTVYTHLRHLKEKTRTKRQAELIHKLNEVRLALRPVTHSDS